MQIIHCESFFYLAASGIIILHWFVFDLSCPISEIGIACVKDEMLSIMQVEEI